MNKTEIEKLGTATAQWLALKDLLKLGHVFSEAHLAIPVAEHLIAHGWCDLRAERHSNTLFDTNDKDPVYYDLDAIRKDGQGLLIEKLILEMKFLKIPNEPRLIKDFAKLALPRNDSGYTRLFMIAESTAGQSNSKIIHDLTKNEKCTFRLSLIDAEQVAIDVTQNGATVCKLKGNELKSVHGIMGSAAPLREFTVECVTNETIGNYRVIIVSVERQESAAVA